MLGPEARKARIATSSCLLLMVHERVSVTGSTAHEPVAPPPCRTEKKSRYRRRTGDGTASRRRCIRVTETTRLSPVLWAGLRLEILQAFVRRRTYPSRCPCGPIDRWGCTLPPSSPPAVIDDPPVLSPPPFRDQRICCAWASPSYS